MPSAVESPLVSQIQLAGIFGVKTDTIRAWERAGCPVERQGGKGLPSQYKPADVIRWREEQAALAASGDLSKLDMNEARRRKIAADAASAEIDLARKRGDLVEVAIIARSVGDALTAVVARLQAIGARLAPMLELATDAATRKEMIDSAINEALHDISRPDFGLFGESAGDLGAGDPGSGDGADAPAREVVRQRVGRPEPRALG